LEDIKDKTKNYFEEKYQTKESWAYCYRKNLPCLRIKTTSRIEGLNGIIKENVSLSTGLCELFHRLLKLHSHKLNKPFPSSDIISDAVLKDLENFEILSNLKNLLSNWSYQQCALSISQSFNFSVKKKGKTYIIHENEKDFDFIFDLKQGFECMCSYYITMGLPCKHLFALAREHPTVVDLKEKVRGRWLKANIPKHFEDLDSIQMIDNYLLQKVNINEKISEHQINDKEEAKSQENYPHELKSIYLFFSQFNFTDLKLENPPISKTKGRPSNLRNLGCLETSKKSKKRKPTYELTNEMLKKSKLNSRYSL